MKKDSNYIWDVQQFVEDTKQIGEWFLYKKLSHSEYDITFAANEAWFGCQGVVRVNRFATGKVGLPNRCVDSWNTWRMMKFKQAVAPGRRFSGNSFRLRKTYDHIENDQMVHWKLADKGIQTAPPVLDFGFDDGRSFIVMHKVPTLINQLTEYPLSQICHIGMNLIHCLQALHGLGYVHQNLDLNSIIYSDFPDPCEEFTAINLIKYSHIQKIPTKLSTFFRSRTKEERFVGNLLFAPPAAHDASRQTRKDDLISAIFILLYLFNKTLPWEAEAHDKNWDAVLRRKHSLIFMYKKKGLPVIFTELLDNVQSLNRFDEPDYLSLYQILEKGKKEEEEKEEESEC